MLPNLFWTVSFIFEDLKYDVVHLAIPRFLFAWTEIKIRPKVI